ncbi:MAG: SH3 domain-containing protein [Pseudomonadota bacterium]
MIITRKFFPSGLTLLIAVTMFFAVDFAGYEITSPAKAQSTNIGKSGFPIPRFVSLKSKRVNMRIGPGKQFKVVWLYLKQGLPIEIIQEYDNWRKVRDPEGNEGWILHSLLSGKRTIIVNPGERDKTRGTVELFNSTSAQSGFAARVEPGVVADVKECDKQWCLVSADGTNGYLEKKYLWGVYPDELIEQ